MAASRPSDANQHEAAAAQISGGRVRYRQRQGDPHGRIDGIAASLQDLHSDTGCNRGRRGHHPVPAVFRQR